MTELLLDRAREGDEDAFRALTDPYRRELHVHCYRILGSVQDAEDVMQETLLAAWRGLSGFEERASLRAWLYRIATNRCLNMRRDSARRPGRAPATRCGRRSAWRSSPRCSACRPASARCPSCATCWASAPASRRDARHDRGDGEQRAATGARRARAAPHSQARAQTLASG